MSRRKTGLQIVGIILTLIGCVGILGGVIFLIFHLWIPGFIVGGIFALMTLAGIICLSIETAKQKKKNALISENKYIMAKVVDIDQNIHQNYRKNNMDYFPYVITCRYDAPDGKSYSFKSRNLYYNPSGLMKEDELKVYVDLKQPHRYYVDTNAILPECAILHMFTTAVDTGKLKKQGQCLSATTCGVELAGQIVFKGMFQNKFYQVSEGVANRFRMPIDERGRVYKGYSVLCRYDAPDGEIHIFISEGILGEPERVYCGDTVKVYISDKNYKKYYVNLKSI